MSRLIGFSIAVLAAAGLSAQNRSGFVNPGGVVRGFGSVVHPGGTSAMPGVQRFTGSVVYPAGGNAQIAIPGLRLNQSIGGRPHNGTGGRRNGQAIWAFPVYVGGGYYDNSYLAPPAQPPAEQQPNVTVIYPPPATPVVIYPSDTQRMALYPPNGPAAPGVYEAPPRAPVEEPAASQPTHYLIAFKDHTIYSAVAYWVDGETLHYFTSGNTHNQVSVSLVDRALTERLNRDTGLEVKLPEAK